MAYSGENGTLGAGRFGFKSSDSHEVLLGTRPWVRHHLSASVSLIYSQAAGGGGSVGGENPISTWEENLISDLSFLAEGQELMQLLLICL